MMLRKIDLRRSGQVAREQFTSVVAERDALQAELGEVRAERDELLARLTDLTNAVRKTWEAEREVQRLHRLREIERAAREDALHGRFWAALLILSLTAFEPKRFAYRPSQTARWKRGIIPPLHE